MTTLEPSLDSRAPLFAPAVVAGPTALLASTCSACGRVEFPRRTSCPACGSNDVVASELVGPARLRVRTAVLAQPPGAVIQAPYLIAVAEFPEGLCVIGLLRDDVEAGSAISPTVIEVEGGGTMFAYAAAAPSATTH